MPYLKVSLFAMSLAAASLPLYIHLPLYANGVMGLSLATTGVILIAIRCIDFIQDPLLGWIVDRYSARRQLLATIANIGMALGFLMVFSIDAPMDPSVWLIISLIVVFTSYSLGAILFYGNSAQFAGGKTDKELVRLASYREVGLLGGVIFAAILPAIFSEFGFENSGYRAFGVFLALLILILGFLSSDLWTDTPRTEETFEIKLLFHKSGFQLIFLALVNAIPVALTSTLFLFFVNDRLMLPELAGGFLIVFFLAAGLSIPLWLRLTKQYPVKTVLICAMTLSIVTFIGAAALPVGAASLFFIICILSGASLGADLLLLPVLFSALMGRNGMKAGQAFGFWFLLSKLSLALAAAVLLPVLDFSGFSSGSTNSETALSTLNFLYALLPCIIKLFAIYLVYRLPNEVTQL